MLRNMVTLGSSSAGREQRRKNRSGPASLRAFFSLKWKVLVFSTVLLAGITAALTALSYFSLQSQYTSQRAKAYTQYRRQIEGLIHRSSSQLQQLGGMIPALTGMRKPLVAKDRDEIRRVFDKQWPTLQIDAGIDQIRFFDTKGHVLATWGATDDHEHVLDRMSKWIHYVATRERPVSKFDCRSSCMQYAVVPMLAEGRSIGVAMIGRSLADIIMGFRQLSGTDVGIVVVDREAAALDKSRRLPAWNANIVAQSNARAIVPVLRKVAREQIRSFMSTAGLTTSVSGRDYEIRFMPLDNVEDTHRSYVVFTEDITPVTVQIRADTRNSLVTSGIGLIAAESLLLAFLWAPMSRLRKTSLSLPLLSESKYDQARDMVTPRWRRLLDDETDVLDQAVMTLSHQLEDLEQEAYEHAAAIAERANELASQKDFVTSLLDTAQAVILTQNSHGDITMVNQFGVSMLGYSEEEMVGRAFTQFVSADDQTKDVYKELADFGAGRRASLHHELHMVCRDGTSRCIAWYHSRPPATDETASVLLSVGIDVTERRVAESRLAWLADHDPLTGLFNRRRFQSELEQTLAVARRYGHTGALLFMDVDQFKDVNDSSGHHTGDMLLKDIAETLAHMVRESDLIGRLGGDEFAILVRETSEEGANDLAKKILEELNQITLPLTGKITRISASIGVTLFPEHGEDVRDLLANADLAMYQAKEAGRSCWHSYASGDKVKERLQQRIYWKSKLEEALTEDRFVLYYQPIMHIRKGTISHYEALLRLRDEDGKIVPPAAFIGIAETAGIIHKIDRMVIHKAIAQMAVLGHAGVSNFNLSINLSAHAFNDPDLVGYLDAELKKTTIDPARLIFEVTETAAVADFAMARNTMDGIKKLGCLFALDDFGVGFSSFYYLKQFPVDFVKIDGSFICQLGESEDDQILVKALSEVAQGFGKKTIAEFVDKKNTLEILGQYGVDYAQGYLLGMPLPADEVFAELLELAHPVEEELATV